MGYSTRGSLGVSELFILDAYTILRVAYKAHHALMFKVWTARLPSESRAVIATIDALVSVAWKVLSAFSIERAWLEYLPWHC